MAGKETPMVEGMEALSVAPTMDAAAGPYEVARATVGAAQMAGEAAWVA